MFITENKYFNISQARFYFKRPMLNKEYFEGCIFFKITHAKLNDSFLSIYRFMSHTYRVI